MENNIIFHLSKRECLQLDDTLQWFFPFPGLFDTATSCNIYIKSRVDYSVCFGDFHLLHSSRNFDKWKHAGDDRIRLTSDGCIYSDSMIFDCEMIRIWLCLMPKRQ